MHQLFLNLVANALKFRRPGVSPVVSVEGGVEVGGRRAGGGSLNNSSQVQFAWAVSTQPTHISGGCMYISLRWFLSTQA